MITRRPRPFAAFLLATSALACAGEGIARFPLADPLWLDADANSLAHDPAPYFSGQAADFLDQVALRPLSRASTIPLEHEAWNVNSLDEVPNSTWFTNRIGWFPMSPGQVAKGACANTPPLDPGHGPWLVVGSKSDGGDVGFTIMAPDGHRYLLKLDGQLQPPRPTTADVVGSRIYYAAGYETPCNEIVYFPEDILRIAPGAKRKIAGGQDVPFDRAALDRLLVSAARGRDGLLRAMASRFIDGKSIGPFRYEGTRPDDPNDVVPHEERRELRGAKLFAAWINHVDSREQNTLDTVVEEAGRRFVRHHMMDWSDALGSLELSDALSRRLAIGRGGYLDLDQVFVDFVTLGLHTRPWNHIALSPEAHTFGYFGPEHFVPAKWRAGYSNPAFLEMTDRDALWAARIMARFTDAHLRAVVAEAKLDDDRAVAFLVHTLAARRDAILRDTLTHRSPLADFTLVRGKGEQSLCFRDLAITANVADPVTTLYKVRLRGGPGLDRTLGWTHFHPDLAAPDQSCIPLAMAGLRPADGAGAAAPERDPLRYVLLEIYSNQHPAKTATAGVVVHLVDLGRVKGFRLVGVEHLVKLYDPP
jgi:hypothetical protein